MADLMPLDRDKPQLLITGATGFVGGHLCELTSQKGWPVRRAVRRTGKPDGVVVGDLGANTDWSAALKGVEIVVHLAARVHVMNDSDNDPLSEFRKINIEGTLNFARQAAAAGIKRFIFISSIKVNGESTVPGQSFLADDQPCPMEPYAVSKMEAEKGLRQLADESGLEVVIIRPPLVYGPNAPGNFRRLLRAVAKGIPLPLGAIHNKRSLVALENLVDLIITCIEHPAAANETFLVSDGEDLSTPELIRRLATYMNVSARLLPVPVWLLRLGGEILGKSAEIDRLCGSLQIDISKAARLLGWRPPFTVDAGLKRTVEWYMNLKA